MNRRDSLSGLLALAVVPHSPRVFAQAAAATKRVCFLSLSAGPETFLRKEVPPLLTKLGWIANKNILYEWRHADGNAKAIPELAARMLALSPDVIVANANITALTAMRLTRSIPIAVLTSLEPVHAGLAQSVGRPGANATGIIWGQPQLAAKIVDFLHQVVPRARRLAVVYDPLDPGMRPYVDADIAAAKALGMECREYQVQSAEDLIGLSESLRKDQIGAVKAVLGRFSSQLRPLIDSLLPHGVPTVSVHPSFVRMGALLAYYPNDSERFTHLSILIDKLLRGARPSDIPFQYPSRFDLAVNLRSAKTLGITIPQSMLFSADLLFD